MYQVILVNLTADARAVQAPNRQPLPGVSPAAMEALLRNFSAIDPIENAVGDTELRVVVRNENFLIRSEQGKLVLYDARHRELAGQILPLERIMEELDGRASAARNLVIRHNRVEAEKKKAKPAGVRPPAQGKTIFLMVAVLFLAAANYQVWPRTPSRFPTNFSPLPPTELASLQRTLSGVYLTGNGPGQHGIVGTGPRELKLFELAAVEAPRVVYATFSPGWSGAKLCLVTDQPGGMVEIKSDGTLVYCGEIYRRIP